MVEKITTLIIDMYGVILKERTGDFVPYAYEHFDESQHECLRKLFDEERLFTKAGYGEISSHEFLTKLGFHDPEYHMKNYIENYLSLDETFISFAEKYYQRCDFVLLSTDVSEWSAYITQYYKLDKYFKHKIVSGDVHCRKADPKIYNITLEQAQKRAEECPFYKKKIAFICVHNSCRSQIAEALGKKYLSEEFECYSAGTETKPQINQDAVRIMKELYDIDMEKEQYSKLLSEIPNPDIAISMGCNVTCPFIGREFDDNWGLDDPTGKADEEFIHVIKQIEAKILEMKNKLCL